MENMTILYPMTGDIVGGHVVSTSVMVKNVKNKIGYDVKVYLPTYGDSYQVFNDGGIKPVVYQLSEKTINKMRKSYGYLNKFKAINEYLRVIRISLTILNDLRPSLVHINDDGTLLNWGIAAKLLNIPVIWHVRQNIGNKLLDKIRVKIADYIIYIADESRNRFKHIKKIPPNKTIYNCVDFNKYYPTRNIMQEKKKYGFNYKKITIGFVGHLMPRKRPEWVVQAASDMTNDNIDVEVILVGKSTGNGKLLEDIKGLIVKSNNPSDFKLLGYRPDVNEIMRAFDVLVVPSKSEAFGRVIIEGMASGLPVLASRVGGIPEIIEDGYDGMMFSSNNYREYYDKLYQLCKDEMLRKKLGSNAYESVKKKYNNENITQSISQVYSEIIAR